MKQVEMAHSARVAGISSNTPKKQIFDQLVRKHGGDRVKAQLEMNKLFPEEKSDLSSGYVKSLYEELAKAISDPMANEKIGQNKIAALRAEINQAAGGGQSGGKITTKAQYDALPRGATYVDPNGVTRTKG
jgi:hypothetical protein